MYYKSAKPLLKIIDELTESKLARINKENRHWIRYRSTEYQNLAIASESIYESYLLIRRLLRYRNKRKLESYQVLDFGSGIGNVLSLLDYLMKADRTTFPNLRKTEVAGIEKIGVYRVNTMCGVIRNIDLQNKPDVDNYLNKAIEEDYDLRIWVCNRPFKDLELQSELEIQLLKAAPNRTCIINPMGFAINLKDQPFKAKLINNHLIVKH